jgi:hypothetical protein
MLFLAPIVFVGVIGNHHEAVEHQLAPSLDKAGVTELAIPDAERAAIVKHTKASKKVIKGLHVGGVIAGQVTGSGADRAFRVVIYDGEGNLTSDLESPIAANGLTKANIHTFEANIADIAASGTPAPGARRAVADDDAPPGLGGSAHPEVATADADDTAPAVTEHAPAASHAGHGIHVRVGLTAGITGRNLAPDPNTVQKYSSTPVPTGGFEGAVAIGARARIEGSFEHTLVMHTDVGGGSVSTGIGHGQLLASYDLVHGSVQVAPAVGFGTRYFAMDTDSDARSPDFEYQYAILGATIARPVGQRWVVRGLAAFEPVVGGVAPGMPEPSRWGFDLGASLEIHVKHVFARAAFDYQSFASSWSMIGGATDAYPSGTLGAGAAF